MQEEVMCDKHTGRAEYFAAPVTIREDGSILVHEMGEEEVMAWQPIETAPKTRILVWDGARIMLANDQEHGEFYTDDSDIIPDPTHWMPLPEPPQTT